MIWLAWNRRLSLLRQLVWLPGLVLFALVAVPWFAAMQARFPDFLNYFFVYNQFQRFTESGFNNPMPFWFYRAGRSDPDPALGLLAARGLEGRTIRKPKTGQASAP